MVAGLIEPTDGRIYFDADDVTFLPTRKRNIGFVFQTPALFPHLSVADNVAFGLSVKGAKKNAIAGSGRRDAGAGRAVGLRGAAASPDVRRAAAAGRARARPRHGSPRAVVRRAAVGARPEPPRHAEVLDPRPPAADRQDGDLRHPRPVRGVRDLGPDRRDERRPSRADRHPNGDLPPAPDAVRGRVHRREQRPRGDRREPRRVRRGRPSDRPRRRPDAAAPTHATVWPSATR